MCLVSSSEERAVTAALDTIRTAVAASLAQPRSSTNPCSQPPPLARSSLRTHSSVTRHNLALATHPRSVEGEAFRGGDEREGGREAEGERTTREREKEQRERKEEQRERGERRKVELRLREERKKFRVSDISPLNFPFYTLLKVVTLDRVNSVYPL